MTAAYDIALAGSPHRFGDYKAGDKIDHVDGITVEEAEHQIATRLYQNTARIHFNQFAESKDRFGRRLIYGGHVFRLRAHCRSTDLQRLPCRGDQWRAPRCAAVCWRHGLRVVGGAGHRRHAAATMSAPCACARLRPKIGRAPTFRSKAGDEYDPAVILDLDYWVLIPQ